MKFAQNKKTSSENDFWNVLIVDDDKEVHIITKIVLRDFSYKNKKIKFFDTYNVEDTKKILNLKTEFSLVLLDIIMETDDSGLILTKYIREDLNNSLIRIILRTGQPGSAPEDKIILDYDINDYKEKTELTNVKLKSSVISSLRSYDELKKIQNHKEQLEKEVEKNIIELRKKDKLLENQNRISQNIKVLNTLAHQWRQPLNIISINANSLLFDIEFENMDKNLLKETSQNILLKTQELSKQIDAFINHYKPSEKKVEISISAFLETIVSLTQSRMKENKITLKKDLNEAFKFPTYKGELEQIVVHLIDNAIDAYEKIDCNEKIIQLKIEKNDKELKISIIDNAGGLSEDIKDNIFLPYFSTKDELNDTGLGLFMSKLLVEEHMNGNLTVDNYKDGCLSELILDLSI
jgi:signal transduction histidine kinase